MTVSPRRPERARGVGRVRGWYHLVRRFFGFLAAKPLAPREQSEVAGLLARGEATLFFRQQMEDQRHALIVARRVLLRRPGDRLAARAALLHDVGKAGVGLGAVQRALATIGDGLGVPLRGAYKQYREHGPYGALGLQDAGAPALVVEFARLHPGAVPTGIDEDQWEALVAADHG